MGRGPLAARVRQEVGIGGLAGIAQRTVDAQQPRKLRVGRGGAVQKHLADGTHAMGGQHHDDMQEAVGAALIIGGGMAEKINSSYVSRVLRLTLLAPDIVEAIVDGRQTEAMTLLGLMETFPMDWLGQRRAFDPNQVSFPDAAQRPFAREFSQQPSRGPRNRPEVEARASVREEQRATTRFPTPFSRRRRAQRGLAAPDMGASWVAPRRSRAG